MPNYTVFHLHTDYSNGSMMDATSKPIDYILKAKECGMTAIGFSEHGSVFNWIEKKMLCDKHGIKYIHGAEFYVTTTLDERRREAFHMGMYARNWEGVKEINRLSSLSYNKDDNHRYYKPRVSVDEVMTTSDNVIVTTACLASILRTESDDVTRFIDWLTVNRHRAFLEIQYHTHPEQIEFNQFLYSLSQRTHIPLIAASDTHALNEKRAKLRLVLQKAKNIDFGHEEHFDLTFKSYDEFVEMFRRQNSLPMDVVLEAIENTNRFSDMVEPFELDVSHKYPRLYPNPEAELQTRINRGVMERGLDKWEPIKRNQYFERIIEEYNVITGMQATDYFLLLDDIINYCKQNSIGTSPRGSCNGSLMLWAMGITDIDSIKYGLPFFRFLNPSRVSLADVDIDMSGKRRDEVKDFLYNYTGIQGSAIITYGTYGLKGAVREVGRGLGIPLDIVDTIAKDIDEIEEEDESGEIKYVTTFHNKEKWFAEYPELMDMAHEALGLIYSVGTHACGFVTSDRDITSEIGLFQSDTSKWPISQNNMKYIDATNYVKMDLLVVDNVQMVDDVCELAGIPRLRNDDIDFEDNNVWSEMLKSGLGIFQFERTGAVFLKEALLHYNRVRQISPDTTRLDLMTALNGIIRPAGDSIRDDFVKGIPRDNGMIELNQFLSKTLGYLSYQEQIMMFLNKFCGYDMAESDYVRRCVEEDSLILMGNGDVKKIKDIEIGDRVQSFTKDGASVSNNVIGVYNNGVRDTYRIATIHGWELILTSDHKVLTQRGFVQVKDLTDDDVIMTPSRVVADDDGLRPNQRLSQGEMFLLGMLIGDGTLAGKSRPSFTNSEEVLIEKFKECVRSRLTNKECEFNVRWQPGKTVEKVYNISIATNSANDSLVHLLKKYNLLHRAADKCIPEEFMSYPPSEKIKSFIAGLFNTDGGSHNVYIDYSTISPKLATQIQSLLLKFGIYSYIYRRPATGYDYDSYRVYINQPQSLWMFGKHILPYIVGKKASRFGGVIEKVSNNPNTFNYLLPKPYKDEIIQNSMDRGISIRSVGEKIGGYASSGLCMGSSAKEISDTKALKLIPYLYAPKTYKLLCSDYIPVRIKSIEHVGERHVYDIEVEHEHNYVANGLIVHNCIAKKGGTEHLIPEIKERFIAYCSTHYPHYTVEHLSLVADQILKVIEDASDYGFSENHSCPYSILGFKGAYLRHYFPLEFLTVQLIINEGKIEKTAKIIEYIKTHTNIRIMPIQFRKSRATYFMSREDNAIYKGIKSIKFLNDQVAEELYAMRENQYGTFVDLLVAVMENTSVNSRQLDILIRLNFFAEFGGNQLLSDIYDEFTSRYKKTYVDKTKQKRLAELYETESVLRADSLRPSRLSMHEQLMFEKEHLGYISSTFPDVLDGLATVLDVNSKYTPKLTLYMLKTGEERVCKVAKKSANTIKPGVVLQANRLEKRPRKTRDDSGRWIDLPDTEDWLVSFSVVS